ncbi:hypothetical protein GO730_20345 [Spirosoma sp. HMF3257]|uniref:HTH luxR-type domain-containing protein n=1 Tax=Spirosoma telluris TaxID=2183553 RepID=A0A327NNF1_9BACT|nr:hypothetical protein [Spirosoma telluris]RAI75919.1 hypothetical protein HMF3257_20270 [Spirosoma telluris]
MTIRPDFSKLSFRQLDIMRLLAQGLDDNDIGTRLGLSTRTIAGHKQLILARWGLSDMADLTRIAKETFL